MDQVKVICLRKKAYDELTDLKKRNKNRRGGYDSYGDVIERLIKNNKKRKCGGV